ncbi:MAG: fumarylacetoacetate hydrolase family protein [Pseudanabaenaceae cyanobacterium]
MTNRYVRVQTSQKVCYGLLELNQSVQVLAQPPWLGETPTGEVLAPDSYKLLAPCQPSKIVAVGRNYADHAAELGAEVPTEPLLFLKPPSAILPPDGKILIPPVSQRVDYEGELALVIGSRAKQITTEDAGQYIWGYTIANDVTARDLQKTDAQWTRSKGFDTFCPLGPWIVREISPAALLQTFIYKEGKKDPTKRPAQSATIDQMIFSPEVLVAYISQVMTLEAGDVILTGTPAGIGKLEAGDRVVVEIEGIGKLQNWVALAHPTSVLNQNPTL